MLQRSEQWFKARAGKFTSSEIHKLMGVKCLGETGKTYAFDKARELFEGINLEDDYVSFDMQKGIELEPYAFDKLKGILLADFLQLETCGFFELNENTGGSPDGIINGFAVAEIKCPKPETFFKLVASNEIDKKYYYQMQHQMLVTGLSKAFFFNYLIYNGQERWHKIEVEKDNEVIELMQSRINEAVAIRNEYLQILNTNKQWN